MSQVVPNLQSLSASTVSIQNDVLYIVDVSDPSDAPDGSSRKITPTALANSIGIKDTIAHQNTNYVLGDGSAGGAIKIYSQITSDNDIVLAASSAADIHVGNIAGGTGVFFIDTDIKVATWSNGTRGTGLRILQENNSSVIEFPTSGGIIELSGVVRGGNGANDDLILRNGSASGVFRWMDSAGTQTMYLTNGGSLGVSSTIYSLNTTATPSGGTTGLGVLFSNLSNFGVFWGSGAPTLSASQGSLYLRTDGSTSSNRAYINTNSGTSWTAILTAS